MNDVRYIRCEEELFEYLATKWQTWPASTVPVITGPTGVGKSSLALRLCEELGYELLSCDSMQIYRGFDIGTAKPTPEERARVPHHLIDICEAPDAYSVARFTQDATCILNHNMARRTRTLLCGGTSQYITALTEGIVFTDGAPSERERQATRQYLEKIGYEAAYDKLKMLDPASASSIASTDKRRIARFFERYHATGLTKSELNQRSRRNGPLFDFVVYFLNYEDRNALYHRINKRADLMVQKGLFDETYALMKQWPDYSAAPAFRGIGYRESVRYLLGELTESDALTQIQTSSRRYAKRQLTWFRKRDVNRLIYRI